MACLSDRRRPGKAHLKTGPFGSSLKSEHWVSEGCPVITIGALGEGKIVDSELLFVNELTSALLYEYQLDIGDVVFSRVADDPRGVVASGNTGIGTSTLTGAGANYVGLAG